MSSKARENWERHWEKQYTGEKVVTYLPEEQRDYTEEFKSPPNPIKTRQKVGRHAI